MMPRCANFETRPVARTQPRTRTVTCDVCVVGSGAAGISAALEAARLGRKVALIEGNPVLGGQVANSLIGTLVGFYSNACGSSAHHLLTYGVAAEMIDKLIRNGDGQFLTFGNTLVIRYDEIAYTRWAEESVRQSDITLVLGAVLRAVRVEGRRLKSLELATRYGDVQVEAQGFVDASGDATTAWLAGLPLQEPVKEVYGTQMFLVENVDEEAVRAIDPVDLKERLRNEGPSRGLARHEGQLFGFPGRGTVLVNLTHISTPLDPIGMSRATLEGRAQADRLLGFLKDHFPHALRDARVRSYGLPGVRQTRWLRGAHRLTAGEVRAGTRFPEAIGRCAWHIELHNTEEGIYWEKFGDDHIHYIPLGCMISPAADNYVAAGRCVDGDAGALSSIRVIGPCMAMGAAAAHALDLAGPGSIHRIDIGALQRRLHDNLSRSDPTVRHDQVPSMPASSAPRPELFRGGAHRTP